MTAVQGAHPSQEFGYLERFHEVVLGAAVEPLDPVGQCAASRQQQCRGGDRSVAQGS